MEFYHLRSFVVVAKTGNLTAAAKQLFTTPPAISAHIKSLEEELKTELFIRSSKGMSLTEKGKLLLPKAEKTLGSAIDMVNLAADNQNEIIGEFTLSINQSPTQLKIPDLLQSIQENCSGIHVNLKTLSSGSAINAIQKGLIDGAFVYGDVPSDIYVIPVKSQKITTIAPYNFTLNNDSLVSELAQSPWITMGNNCPFDEALNNTFDQFTKANIQTSDDYSRLQLVKANQGLSFIEHDEAIKIDHAQHINILPQLDFDIDLFCVFKKSRIEEPIIKAIMQEITTLSA